MSSSRSRKLRLKRRYHRTQVTITSGSNLRFLNNGGRHYLIASPYQIRRCNTAAVTHPQLALWIAPVLIGRIG